MTTRVEKINVLFGSQTGNSEQAAQDLCSQAADRLSPEAIQKLTGTKERITVQPVCMQLDDFLELDRCAWTRLTVIITSSYGVGQAPLGGYRFRELCDAWLEDEAVGPVLSGFSYALCGLGDSKYTTFFKNPTRIDAGLQKVGAKRVGPLGKCDASGTGSNEQPQVIARWMDDIWKHLAQVVVEPPLEETKLVSAQAATVDLCRKINPDFLPEPQQNLSLWALVVVVMAILLALYFKN